MRSKDLQESPLKHCLLLWEVLLVHWLVIDAKDTEEVRWN